MVQDKDEIYSLYNQHKNGIYRYILSITKDPCLAEDVLQDVFIKLLTKEVHLISGKEYVWLYKVARNRCYDLLKKENRCCSLTYSEAPPDQNWKFIELISSLSQQEQEMMALKYIAGFTHKDIAKITGQTVHAAKKRYERALQKLRKEMEESL